MTPPIDFAGLSLMDALDLALLIEEDAKARYVDLMAHALLHICNDAASFFGRMAEHEEKHRAALARRRAELFGTRPRSVKEETIRGVESWGDVSQGQLSCRAALQVALRAERAAYKFFNAAIPRLQNAEVAALFTELRDEEIEHQRMVLDELERTPPESSLKAAV